MALSVRENFLRNAAMTGPEWMPTHVVVNGAMWHLYGSALDEVLLRHPALFPGFEPGRRESRPTNEYGVVEVHETTTDAWGVTWEHNMEGIMGLVTGCPLEDWAAFDDYRVPDIPGDWEQIARDTAAARARGELTAGYLDHGFLFMRLYYLRGFENLMMDYAAGEPRLHTLIDRVADFNETLVRRYAALGVDVIEAGDDLGTQTASLVSPAAFARWITPAYRRVFAPARAAGAHVSLHSDGHMIELIDELIAAGVTICNPQDLCNGVDEIKAAVDGRICIRLDIDRQRIVPFGTPREIRDHIGEAVRKLGSPRGGLELVVGLYPPTPLENVEAVCAAFEEYRTYWFK